MFFLKRWFGWIPWKAWIVLVVATLLGTGLAIGVYFSIRMQEKQMNRMMFFNAADNSALYIEGQMNQIYELLTSLANYFTYSTGGMPTFKDFQAVATPFLESTPAFVAVEFVPYILDADRGKWETENDMIANWTILTIDAITGSIVRESTRSSYYPIYYIVPLNTPNKLIAGLDYNALPDRQAITQVFADGKPLILASLYYEAGMLSPYGLVYAVPVRNATTQAVTAVIVGVISLDYIALMAYMTQMNIMAATASTSTGTFAYSVFQVNADGSYTFFFYSNGDMSSMASVMATGNATSNATNPAMLGMNMNSLPGTTGNWPYTYSNPRYLNPNQMSGSLTRTEAFSFGGVNWIMKCTNPDNWGTWVPWTMMSIVLALTILLVGYLVFSIWGYKKAFDAANQSSTNGDSSGMFSNKVASNGHTGEATKDDNIE
jgi:hypothetical protein